MEECSGYIRVFQKPLQDCEQRRDVTGVKSGLRESWWEVTGGIGSGKTSWTR